MNIKFTKGKNYKSLKLCIKSPFTIYDYFYDNKIGNDLFTNKGLKTKATYYKYFSITLCYRPNYGFDFFISTDYKFIGYFKA